MNAKRLGTLLSLIIAMTVSSLTYSGAVDITDISTEFQKPLTFEQSGIGFEFENDTNHSVWIAVQNNTSGLNPIEVKPHSLKNEITGANNVQQKINIKKSTKLIIWFDNPGSEVSASKSILGLFGATKITPEPNLIYTFKPGKTIYVTLDKHYNLVPSQAIEGSIATETGLSLENNVQSDISLILKKQ